MEQQSKKEYYEAARQEKMQARKLQTSEGKQRRVLTWTAVAVPVGIIIALLAYILIKTGGASIPDIGQTFPDQGRDHIADGASHPAYNSNPPTSGWHYATPADWGVVKEELPQERLVHNLEHGGIVIQYKPDLDKTIVEKLENLKKSAFECKLVVAPYKGLDKAIALTAWHRLYKTDTYEETTIKNFIKKYRDTGPEFVPCSAKAAPMQQAK